MNNKRRARGVAVEEFLEVYRAAEFARVREYQEKLDAGLADEERRKRNAEAVLAQRGGRDAK